MNNRILNLLLVVLIIVLYSTTSISQEQDKILRMLDSPKYIDRSNAIMIIHQNKLMNYSYAVEERIFLQPEADLVYSFLQTLADLNSTNLHNIANRFLDTINYYPNVNKEINDLLEARVTSTGILIKFNDYSTINYVWELIERDKSKNKFQPVLLSVLGNLLYVPEYENRAKDELLYYFNNDYYKSMEDGLYNFRPIILGILTKRYGLEIKDLLISSFLYDPAGSIQASSMQYLLELNYSGLDSLLIDRLYINESDSTIRPMVALAISTRLNTPERLYMLQTYRPPIQNEHRAQGIAIYVAGVKPKQPVTENTTENIDITESFIDKLLIYTWLGDLTFSNDLKNILTTAKTYLQTGDSLACRVQVKTFQDLVDNVYKDSLNSDARFVTIEGWKFLYWNAQYILDMLPEPPANPNLVVNLKNSLGNQIPASNVQYYESGWKDAINNGDGTFTVITTKPTISIRVFYEYASQQMDNVPAQNNTYTFTTVNAAVQLKNSLGNLIDQGTVQYYAGAWRNFGTTSNGVANKELLTINYSFRMTYEYGSIDKQQNLSSDPTVIFQTVNAAVQLKNSLGSLIDAGTVQYYAVAWRTFGTTSNGVAYKELLPINYSFRMTYEYGSIDKQQNLSSDPTVVFQTVNSTVKLLNSQNALIDQGTVQYYAGAWRSFGTTSNGVATKELLPINYSFRMTYEYVSKDKQQNLSTNPVVDFNTVLCSVKVSKTSDNQPINNATVKYYAGAWRNLGTTNSDGITIKELLPANISFRATSGNVSLDKQQDISANSLVEIILNIP